jgi:flagellar biosynthesis/type III secretory pathway M-ring protein FliF/YscJ
MDLGIVAPVLGVVLAVVVALILRRIMRLRTSKTASRAADPSPSESETEFLDASHIGGPIVGDAADPGWKATDRSAPPRDKRP